MRPRLSSVAPLDSPESVPASHTRDRVVALPTEPSEAAALVEGIIARRPQALAELFDRFAPLVRRLLARTLGDRNDVDDLTQDTFMVVVRRAAQIQEPSALRSFIVGTAIRVSKNEVRKRAIRRWVGLEDALPSLSIPPDDVVARQRVRHLYGALDRLDADSRTLFVLRHVEGLELTEIAAACECSVPTVKRRLARLGKRFDALLRADPVLRDFLEGGAP
jgi:RNA polymerase sigma-70 factor (ECF subfamily)